MGRSKLASLACSAALLLLSAGSVAYAAGGNDQGQNNNNQGQNGPKPPSLAATPELDSIVLFGAGLLGAGGLGYWRMRVRRRA